MKESLAQKVDIRSLGELNYFLGVQITQDTSKKSIFVGTKTLVQITEHCRTKVIEHAQFSITLMFCFLVPHLTICSVVVH